MQAQEQQKTAAHQYRRRLTVCADPSREIMARLRELADDRYPRRLKVLAARLGWDRTRLSKLLNGTQPAYLADAVAIAAALCVPLSEVLHQANL